jgi:hypothetical protein
MTAYTSDGPLGVGCVNGVKVGKGNGAAVSPTPGVLSAGTGDPRYNVGVPGINGPEGVAVDVEDDCAQALRARMTSREVSILLFIVYPLLVIILAFFEGDCKSVR